jgi:hypothetical protein
MRFPAAPPNRQVLLITGLFVLTFLYFCAQYTVNAIYSPPADGRDLLFAALVGVMMVWRAANAVRAYILETGGPDGPELVIQQWVPWRRPAVPLDRLRRVDANPAVRSILNTNFFNLGGLFGWAGASTVPELGTVLVYATSRSRLVLLELAPRGEQRLKTSDGKEAHGPAVLVSPRDPTALVAALVPFRRVPAGLVLPDLTPPPAPAPAAAPAATAPPAPRRAPASPAAAPRPAAPPPTAARKKKR